MKESLPTYVVTEDTKGIFEKVNGSKPLSKDFLRVCDDYFNAIQRTIVCGMIEAETRGYPESEINAGLSETVRKELSEDSESYCICLDRYLLKSLEKQFPDRFFRFSITRTLQGKKVPRVGDPSFEAQVNDFKKRYPDFASKQAVIVDDGIFSGGTVRDAVELFRTFDVALSVKRRIGFIGASTFNTDGTRILEPTNNLYDWVDIRDFSPLGGKTSAINRNNRVATSVPYLYPWSYGEGASFKTSPNLFTMSEIIIREYKTLVETFEKQEGRTPLRFRELVDAGFALPVSVATRIPISINDRVVDYLDRCLETLNKEQKRSGFILDMDGTLYLLDGNRNGFTGSSLEKMVCENAVSFIIKNESCSQARATEIYREGINDPIGVSNYLSKRYGISRREYFDIVWDIDPEPILQQYEQSAETIRALSNNSDTKLILLTSAPSSWVSRVLKTLGIDRSFELIFTGEEYGSKDEIFKTLSQWYVPSNFTSIGDQIKTDILPAQQYGFNTFLVTSPDDLTKLTYI